MALFQFVWNIFVLIRLKYFVSIWLKYFRQTCCCRSGGAAGRMAEVCPALARASHQSRKYLEWYISEIIYIYISEISEIMEISINISFLLLWCVPPVARWCCWCGTWAWAGLRGRQWPGSATPPASAQSHTSPGLRSAVRNVQKCEENSIISYFFYFDGFSWPECYN